VELIDAHEFRERYFSDRSRPSARTVTNWCAQQKLPARKIGGEWYIDAEIFEAESDQGLVTKILTA
jgi:hypothetical protein